MTDYDIIMELLTKSLAREQEALRNPTPEQAERQARTRRNLHHLADELQGAAHCIDGEGVLEREKVKALYRMAYFIHDIVEGDPLGTYERRRVEEAREERSRMKSVSSFDELVADDNAGDDEPPF